jgi:hypothetical protein
MRCIACDFPPTRRIAYAISKSLYQRSLVLRHQNMSRRIEDLQAAKAARGDCQIKGDITAAGEHLYRRPGERDYEWVWISEAKGERWFCSVDEAEAAGWHAAEN